MKTTAYDRNKSAVELVNSGRMPFEEHGAEDLLCAMLNSGLLTSTDKSHSVSQADHVVVVVGTPVDEYLQPNPSAVVSVIADLAPELRDGQHLSLRSTLYPGVTRAVEQFLQATNLRIDVTYCPERIVEGRALTELTTIPQIVSGRNAAALNRARDLFGRINSNLIELSPEEAELAKLFSNAWRYVKFAVANQFFMMANDAEVNFGRIHHAMTTDYPRAADLPRPGFAAGPCLFKDTMQLTAFSNGFAIGHSSMLVNEGLPNYLVSRLGRSFDLKTMTIGILGMAFKGESDDSRSSLSYKLRRLLQFKCKNVICADSNIKDDPRLTAESTVLAEADLIIIGAPHTRYANLSTNATVINIWNSGNC
jgi:UDP-N-acetyl-D-mannosaminuronic acid dehydrogenase